MYGYKKNARWAFFYFWGRLIKLIRTSGRKYIRDFMIMKLDFGPLLVECGMRPADKYIAQITFLWYNVICIIDDIGRLFLFPTI